MASRQFRGQRSSKHSEHDDRFDTRTAKNSERSSRRFDNFEKNRDLSSKYDEESTNLRRTSSFADKPVYKGRQYHSRNDNELRENIENKIKFQESFGIERRPSKRFELENTKKVNDDFENSGRRSTNNETSKTGEIKDLRQLLQSKRRQSHDDKAENDKKPSISGRLGSKIKEEETDDKQPRTDRNSSRFSENSARLVNRFLDDSRKPSKVEEKATKLQQSDKKPSSVDEKSTKNDETSSEPPQRIRKPVRIRNPASRLADLVRNQVVDAVKKNEKKKSSTNSTSSKSTSHESLIEISSSSDDVKIVEVSKPIEKELDTAMDRLKTDFDEISNSGSENWADMVEEEEIVEKIEILKKHQKVDLHTTIMAALKRNRECIQDSLIQVDKNTEKHVQFKEPIKPESSTLQRSSSMSSLAENKPHIQKNQPRVEHQKNQQPEARQPNRFQRNQSNQLHRTHSQYYQGSQPRRMQRTNSGHFEAPPAIRPDIANSIEFQKFRFGSTDLEYNPLTKQYMHQGPSPFHHQVPMPQNQPQRYNSINWNEYPQRDAQIRGFEANYEPQQILNYPQEETRNSNYQEIPNLTSNYQEIPHLTSNYQEVQNLSSNTQIIPAIPNIYNFPPPKLDSIQFASQNIQNFIDFQDSAKFKERTPSPAPSTSSSSSSSSATDLFGAPSKLSARLSMIRENKTKFSDGNKSSSLESLKSNGFNANAKVFYPKQSDTSIVPYQQQVESTEPLFYDSHHSFELSAYVDKSLDEIEEPCDKLTHDQLVNLMYVTKTSKKYINEALSYFVEYYDELGCKLSKNAVDEVLMEKGIESKICDFGQML